MRLLCAQLQQDEDAANSGAVINHGKWSSIRRETRCSSEEKPPRNATENNEVLKLPANRQPLPVYRRVQRLLEQELQHEPSAELGVEDGTQNTVGLACERDLPNAVSVSVDATDGNEGRCSNYRGQVARHILF